MFFRHHDCITLNIVHSVYNVGYNIKTNSLLMETSSFPYPRKLKYVILNEKCYPIVMVHVGLLPNFKIHFPLGAVLNPQNPAHQSVWNVLANLI